MNCDKLKAAIETRKMLSFQYKWTAAGLTFLSHRKCWIKKKVIFNLTSELQDNVHAMKSSLVILLIGATIAIACAAPSWKASMQDDDDDGDDQVAKTTRWFALPRASSEVSTLLSMETS